MLKESLFDLRSSSFTPGAEPGVAEQRLETAAKVVGKIEDKLPVLVVSGLLAAGASAAVGTEALAQEIEKLTYLVIDSLNEGQEGMQFLIMNLSKYAEVNANAACSEIIDQMKTVMEACNSDVACSAADNQVDRATDVCKSTVENLNTHKSVMLPGEGGDFKFGNSGLKMSAEDIFSAFSNESFISTTARMVEMAETAEHITPLTDATMKSDRLMNILLSNPKLVFQGLGIFLSGSIALGTSKILEGRLKTVYMLAVFALGTFASVKYPATGFILAASGGLVSLAMNREVD